VSILSETIFEFRNVSYAVGGQTILEDLSFAARRGEVLALLGESGCGKTTTLKLINKLLLPTMGDVIVFGRSTRDWDAIELRRKTGYVLQEAGLFPHFTVAQNVALVPGLLGWDSAKTERRTAEMLALTGLENVGFAARFPHELSGGQRQRVGVARALAADPELLLLDEPFGALDPITRTRLQIEFAALVKQMCKTAVFVTHDLREAMRLGARIALLEKGRIALLATPEDFAKSDHPLARAYLETINI
jgi:osmoprotectant transport system ATP-binding protein